MKERDRKLLRVALVVLGALLIPGVARASQASLDSLFLQGVEYVFDAHFDEGLGLFQEAIRREPDNPAGYFFRASAYWWLFARDPALKQYDRDLLAYLDDAIVKAEDALARDENDAEAVMYLGGAIGLRARFHVLRTEWWPAASDGKRAYKLLQRAVELDSTLYDVYQGLGMYEYYTSVLPTVVKVAQILLMIPRGDKERGLQQLELARQRGKFGRAEAEFFLIDIYLDYEKRYQDALLLTQDLRRRYPDNPYFELLEGVIYVDYMGRYPAAARVLEGLRQRADEGRCFFAADVALRSRYYLGKAQLWQRHYPEAAAMFEQLLRENPGEPVWLLAWSHFRLGQAYDLLGQRERALAEYRRVLDGPTVGSVQDHARRMIEKPFTMK